MNGAKKQVTRESENEKEVVADKWGERQPTVLNSWKNKSEEEDNSCQEGETEENGDKEQIAGGARQDGKNSMALLQNACFTGCRVLPILLFIFQ